MESFIEIMKNKKIVSASAPGKLMLFGEHSVVYGHPCIVTAVDQRLTVNIHENGEDVFTLEAPDLQLHAYAKTMEDLGKKPLPKGVRFIEILYKNFLKKHPQERGIHVTTRNEFNHTFGFGSSSAVTVAFAKALTTLYDITLTNKDLFDLCYEAVIEVQGVGSGFDIAAAIWGGTIFYVPAAEEVIQLNVEELPLVVGYTGIKADTPTIVRMVASLKNREPDKVEQIFENITVIVKKAQQAFIDDDKQFLGNLASNNQDLLRELGVSTKELDNLIKASEQAGSYGAKLSGAGGGDCMIAFSNGNKSNIEKAIDDAGGKVLHIKTNAPGVRIESSNK